METKAAVTALAALAQESRLGVFRLLVQAGPSGMAAGKIGETLGIAPSSLSFHMPAGKVNEHVLAILAHHGLATERYRCRSRDEFEDAGIDILITVCASAMRGHRGLPDRARVQGTPEPIEAAFEATYGVLERRIHRLPRMPIADLSRRELADTLNRIGRETD